MLEQHTTKGQGKLILPRDLARAAAKELVPNTLAALAADVLASREARREPGEGIKRFARDLTAATGLGAFEALEAVKAAVVHESALRFIALVTGDRAD